MCEVDIDCIVVPFIYSPIIIAFLGILVPFIALRVIVRFVDLGNPIG